MPVTFRRLVPADADLLAEFLTGRDGTLYDAIGYAIVRSDWETGTVTRPDWDDEPRLAAGQGDL